MTTTRFYPAIFEPEDVGYSVLFPDLPGCGTQGDTLAEALSMAQEAIGLYLEGTAPKDYPAPSDPAALHPEGRQFLMVVPFDQLAYDKKYNAKAVRKTLSIPAWLNNLAKANNINFSSVLQNALCRELHIQST